MKNTILILTILLSTGAFASNEEDSLFLHRVYDEALENGQCYGNLRNLCKNIGARITGSAEAAMAIEWGKDVLDSYNVDNVYLQEIKVPHWERGTPEAGWIINEKGQVLKLHMIALGGSVGTGGLIGGEVIEVETIAALEEMTEEEFKGKIVFISEPFDQKFIHTFKAYGACISQRWDGASIASKLKAKAVVIRSLASSTDEYPHTGSMHYEDGVTQIPGAAISTMDSDILSEWLKEGKVYLKMEMDCRWYPDVTSYNVIAEIFGSEDDKIITFGGHLDSWDAGEGAHDDGAGIVHCIEAMRILHELGYQPNHTLRCVLFMNEENGNFGGKSYAEKAVENKEDHICAIESDRGGFLPLGFDIVGTDQQVSFVREFKDLLADFELYKFNPGYGGVDISPLLNYYPDMIQLGLAINSQEYFNYHHSDADVFEAVNQRELELGSAAMAVMLYLMDQNL